MYRENIVVLLNGSMANVTKGRNKSYLTKRKEFLSLQFWPSGGWIIIIDRVTGRGAQLTCRAFFHAIPRRHPVQSRNSAGGPPGRDPCDGQSEAAGLDTACPWQQLIADSGLLLILLHVPCCALHALYCTVIN